MKLRYLAAVALVAFAVVPAHAQTHEFFGGVSGGDVYLYLKGPGWTGSYAYNVGDSFAIVAEGSGTYRNLGNQTEDSNTGEVLFSNETRLKSHTLGAGPRFRTGSGDIGVFAQALVGASLDEIVTVTFDQFSSTENTTYLDQFAIMPGAGIDVRLTESVKLRSQAEMLLKRTPEVRNDTGASTNVTNAAWDTAFRLAVGIVVGF